MGVTVLLSAPASQGGPQLGLPGTIYVEGARAALGRPGPFQAMGTADAGGDAALERPGGHRLTIRPVGQPRFRLPWG